MNTVKSRNQLYRESGSLLPFKAWLQQHMNNVVHQALVESEYLNYDGQAASDSLATEPNLPFKPVLEKTSILGIPKNYLYAGLMGLVLYSAYKLSESTLFNK